MSQPTAPQSLAECMSSRLARSEERHTDWQFFAAQAALDPRHARGQTRYIAPGGKPGVVAAQHFTLATITFPPGHCSPLHRHDDAEEVFLVLSGTIKVVVAQGDERYEVCLGPMDLLSVPAGLYRQEINIGERQAVMCVLMGTGHPHAPVMLENQE